MDSEELQKLLLQAVLNSPGSKPRDLNLVGGKEIPRQTLSRYLARMVKQGDLRVEGRGPATRYFATDLDHYLALPVAQRSPVGYRRERASIELPRFSAGDIARFRAAADASPGATAEERARGVREQLMIELSYASSKLEGNTYTLLETQALIEYGQSAKGKAPEEARMILNHRDAIRYLLDNVSGLNLDWTTVRDLHSMLSDGLLSDPGDSGRIRRRGVAISNSSYRPLENEYQLREALELMLSEVNGVTDVFSKALMLAVGIAYIQPFMDCNKRTGRVMANLPLLQAGLPPLSFVTIDKVGYISGLLAYYELGVGDRIRSALAEAYVASAEAYRSLVGTPRSPAQEVAELKYRGFLRERVRTIVLDPRARTAQLPETIPAPDRVLVEQLLQRQLDTLHAGRAAVIGVSPAEIEAYLRRRGRE